MPIEFLRSSPQQIKTLLWLIAAFIIIFFWPLLKSLHSIHIFNREIYTPTLTVKSPFAWATLAKGDYVQVWRPCRIILCYAPPSLITIEKTSENISRGIWKEGMIDTIKTKPYTTPVFSIGEVGAEQMECLESRSMIRINRIFRSCYSEKIGILAMFDGVGSDVADFNAVIESATAAYE